MDTPRHPGEIRLKLLQEIPNSGNTSEKAASRRPLKLTINFIKSTLLSETKSEPCLLAKSEEQKSTGSLNIESKRLSAFSEADVEALETVVTR